MTHTPHWLVHPANAVLAAFATAALVCAPAQAQQPAPVPVPAPLADASSALLQLRADAVAVAPFATSPPAREFAEAVVHLPAQAPRKVFTRKTDQHTLSAAQHARLAVAERSGYEPVLHDEAFFYATFYGTPLAYVRPLEVAARHGLRTLQGQRVLDIGYGAIGAMRMLAAAGAEVAAVDVDSLLPALYDQRADQGIVRGGDGRVGSLALYDGVFAGDVALTKALGRHFDLIVSKNTLKRGFMKPTPGRKPWVEFGVTDSALLAALKEALAPGGLLVIYNLSGKFDATKPPTDGRSPFDRAQFEAAGFDVLAIDEADDSAARGMGQALGWSRQMGDLTQNLFALVTVVRVLRPSPSR